MSTNCTETLMITEPVLATEPAYRGHVLKSLHVKPRSLNDNHMPVIVASIDISDPTEKPPVPYRLPRISPQVTPRLTSSEELTSTVSDMSDKMWGRFGYEEVIRIPALTPNINKVTIMNSPQIPHSQHPAFNPSVPRFRNAAITPSKSFLKDKDEFTVYKSMVDKAKLIGSVEQGRRPDPTSSPVSRVSSPAKSVKSIHWALGNSYKRQIHFDKTGRGRAQGPFSREFTVTCYAPHNWLRLKLGRSKTTLH